MRLLSCLNQPVVVAMCNMPKGSVGIIRHPNDIMDGRLVKRCFSVDAMEERVELLTGDVDCWTWRSVGPDMAVELLPPGTIITLEVQ